MRTPAPCSRVGAAADEQVSIAVLPDHGTASTTLLRRADEALRAAEQGGRDGWRVADPELRAASAAEPGRRGS